MAQELDFGVPRKVYACTKIVKSKRIKGSAVGLMDHQLSIPISYEKGRLPSTGNGDLVELGKGQNVEL